MKHYRILPLLIWMTGNWAAPRPATETIVLPDIHLSELDVTDEIDTANLKVDNIAEIHHANIEELTTTNNARLCQDVFICRDLSVGRNEVVDGNLSVAGNETVEGNFSLGGSLTGSGPISAPSLSITNDATIGCELIVGCNIEMVDSIDAGHGNILKAGIPFIHNFGTNNTFVGKDSGNFTMTSTGDNVGVGFETLFLLDAGLQNTALGSQALASNVSGNFNTAVGTSSLFSNTSSSNTAVGAFALFSNTAGSNNTAVGLESLSNNTTSFGNTGVGYFTLLNNSTGIFNTAMGGNALQSNNGDQNTAVGYASLISNSSGNDNTAVGRGTLSFLSTGNTNLALGLNAGNAYTGAETNNILIRNAGVVGESNTIRIGSASHTRNFQAGIQGVNNAAVLADQNTSVVSVNNNRQLGTGEIWNDINLANTSGSQGAILKSGTLFLHNFGTSNTFLGVNSGNRAVTLTGIQNTGIGNSALTLLTSGTSNTALGFGAGSLITTGSNDIVIGNVGVAAENNTIRIGNGSHTRNFQTGIQGVDNASILADQNTSVVSVNNNGQLGTGEIWNDINLANTSGSQGAILKSGSLFIHNFGTNNTFLGVNSGNRTMTLADFQNTGIGTQALNSLTSGTQNTAVGAFALQSNTSGGENTAFGTTALNNNTTGFEDVAVGTAALYNLTTGSGNIGIGQQAFSFNSTTGLTTGSFNVGIGYQTGNAYTGAETNNILIRHSGVVGENNTIRIGTTGSQTRNFQAGISGVNNAGASDTSAVSVSAAGQLGTGEIWNDINLANTSPLQGAILKSGSLFIHNSGTNNTFVGVNSGNRTLTGDRNTGIGVFALQSNTSGVANTAVGENALQSNTAGPGNTAIGANALTNNVAIGNSHNVAVGANALFNMTTGGFNVGIGTQVFSANPSATGLMTGIQNVGIGYLTGSAYTGSESANILITNPGVVGENNTIRIGTTGNGAGQQNKCFIAGIINRGPFANTVTIDHATEQLGELISSRTFKSDIEPISTETANAFFQLKPSKFYYKNDPAKNTWYGFIAEDVEPLMPEIVNYQTNEKGIKEPRSINYNVMYALLLKVIQENRSLINNMKREKDLLKKKVSTQKKLVKSLVARVELMEKTLKV
jgi:hypothetical protein